MKDFELGVLVGLLIGEGHFGGDGRQPQVTLRMSVQHEKLFHWLLQKVPGSRLYGPYSHGGRSYYQWMVRGSALREFLLPLLDSISWDEIDSRAAERYRRMKTLYGLEGETMTEPTHPPFEVIDHTSDVGIVAYGRDFKELLGNAALGMFSLMTDLSTVKPKEKLKVVAQISVSDRESLLLHWLKELHYLKEGKRFIPCRAFVTEISETEVRGFAEGELMHDDITPLHHIKAVTRHMLQIEEMEDGWLRVQVIFDV